MWRVVANSLDLANYHLLASKTSSRNTDWMLFGMFTVYEVLFSPTTSQQFLKIHMTLCSFVMTHHRTGEMLAVALSSRWVHSYGETKTFTVENELPQKNRVKQNEISKRKSLNALGRSASANKPVKITRFQNQFTFIRSKG